jgi:hypothetical protein
MVTGIDSPFLNEGKDILISEFGREYGTYFSILQLIASGKTTQSEVDSIIGKNTGTYLLNLEKEYSLIVKNKPMFSKPESRNTRWKIHDNFLRFWFRFIFPNQALVETGRLDLLREIVKENYNNYSGLVLENYFRDRIAEEGWAGRKSIAARTDRVTAIGGYWDKKGENEIDIIALSGLDKTALVAEVKRNPKKISLSLLAAKAESLRKELSPYKVELKGLSLADM